MRDILERFAREERLVRGDQDVGHGDQTRQGVVVHNVSREIAEEEVGFLLVHVQARRADLPCLDPLQEHLGIDERTA